MKFDNEKIQKAYDAMATFFGKFAKDESIEPIKFKEEKLQDGVTIIQYDGDMPMQGMPINVVTAEGVLPIPDGEYIMADGAKLVTSGGLCAEYIPAEEKPAEGEVTEPAAAPAAGEMEQKTAPKRVIKSQVEEHVFHLEIEGIEPIKLDFSELFNPIKEENKALKDLNKQLFNVIKEISESPAAPPTEPTKNKFSVIENKRNFKADIDKITENYYNETK